MTPREKIHNYLLELYSLTFEPAKINMDKLAKAHKVATRMNRILKEQRIIENKFGLTKWIYKGRIDSKFAAQVHEWVNEYARANDARQRMSIRHLKNEQLERIEQKLDTILKHLNINQ
jgi:capsid protein